MAKKSEDELNEGEAISSDDSINDQKNEAQEKKPILANTKYQELPALDYPKKSILKSKQEDDQIQKVLVDNFVNLQKVMTNLAIKFDELSLSINKLLQLFEISAKNFAEKYSDKDLTLQSAQNAPQDKDLIEKLDALLDQNRIIAKGIMLMEEKLRIKAGEATSTQTQNASPIQNRQELPQTQNPNPDNRFGSMFRSRPLPKF